MSVDLLQTPIEYLKGVGPKRGELLRKEAGVSTYYDMLTYYPFRHVDRSRFTPITEINSDNTYIQIRGKVVDVQMAGQKNAARLVVTIRDATSAIELLWFQGISWVKDKFTLGSEWIVFGKPSLFNGRYNMSHPETESVAEYNAQPADPLHPVYSSTDKMKLNGLSTRAISKITKSLIAQLKGVIPEILSNEVMDQLKLLGRENALFNFHFPTDTDNLEKARARLKFDELFLIQIKLLRYKLNRFEIVKGNVFGHIGELFNGFYKEFLPFELINSI